MMAKKGGLGKGLDALFVDNATDSQSTVSTIRLSQVEPNKDQPRREFDPAALSELADSIREHGVLQPIIVRPLEGGTYQIVAGERRWRASRMAGLTEIPVVVKELDDLVTMELALIENLQREDLTAIEEAQGYHSLMELYGMTQEQVSKRVGKSRPVVANALRLLSLPAPILVDLMAGRLSPGHARVLAGVEDPIVAVALSNRVMDQNLSVRALERLAKSQKEKSKQAQKAEDKSRAPLDQEQRFYREMEIALQEALGRKVRISQRASGGTLEVEFFSRGDLSDLARRLSDEELPRL